MIEMGDIVSLVIELFSSLLIPSSNDKDLSWWQIIVKVLLIVVILYLIIYFVVRAYS